MKLRQQCSAGVFTSQPLLRRRAHARNSGAACNTRGALLIQSQQSPHYRYKSSLTSVPSQSHFESSRSKHFRHYSQKKFDFNSNPETSFLERVGLRRKAYQEAHNQTPTSVMASNYYLDGTPDEVKNAKGLHLITMNTPNGQGKPATVHEPANKLSMLMNCHDKRSKSCWKSSRICTASNGERL